MTPSADRTALLLLDMQNGFCDPAGSLSALGFDVTGCAAAVMRCQALAAAARRRQVPVIHCTTELLASTTHPGSLARFAELSGLAPGTWDAAIVNALSPEPADHRIVKHRWNAFYGTPLDSLLFGLGAETVITTGVLTSLSVQSTVRDSAHRDYRNWVVADATADIDAATSSSALRALEWAFCAVVSAEHVLAAWASTDR